jgi:hypothetical protein
VSVVRGDPDSVRLRCWCCPLSRKRKKRIGTGLIRDDQKLKLKKQSCRECVDGGEAGLILG